VKRYLNASEVAELAELLEEFPIRVGAVEEVLQAAAEKRGMTLALSDAGPVASRSALSEVPTRQGRRAR
jgi:hypothetical protein